MTADDASDADVFVEVDELADTPWERLETYLAAQGHEFRAADGVARFAHGYGNVNYRVIVDGRPFVLRRPPPGPLPLGGNDLSREYRVLSRLNDGFAFAPRALVLCDDESVIGVPFLIMEHRAGIVVRESVPAALAGREGELSEMLVETLATLHEVDPAAVDLDGLGRPEGFLSRTVEGWIKRAHVAAAGTPPAAIEDIEEWLHDNLVADGEPCLIHNDFKLNNIILERDDPVRPAAVIDWDMCTRGDALFDLATLLSYWTEPGDPPALHGMRQMPTAAPGFLTRQAAAERYAARTGVDLTDFIFHRVLATFKLGVVFLQLHRRYQRGLTRDERFAGFRKVAEGLFDFALEIAAARVF